MKSLRKQFISKTPCIWRYLEGLLGIVVLLLSPVIRVNADTTEDLLNVYGLTLGGPIKSEIEKEMEALERDIISMQAQNNMTEEYNAMLKEYIEKRESFIDSILNDVYSYQSKNSEITSEISDGILDMSIDELLRLDAQYKTNSSYADDLLSTMNNYRIDYDYRSITSDLSIIEQRLSQTRAL